MSTWELNILFTTGVGVLPKSLLRDVRANRTEKIKCAYPFPRKTNSH